VYVCVTVDPTYPWHPQALLREAAMTLSSGGRSVELSACLRNALMYSLFSAFETSRGIGVI
jgi:hypothetical protein